MEQELKLALARPADLGRLLGALPEPRAVIRQFNHYMVCPEKRTSEAKVMVRLRVEERGDVTTACLTLKRRVRAQDGVFLSWELEEAMAMEQARAVLDGHRDLMEVDHEGTRWLAQELNVRSLDRQGSLTNVRHVVDFEGYVLEVDRSEFPDGSVDVEIEVETDDPAGARIAVVSLTTDEGIALFEQTLGKYTRYLQRGGQR
jgi:uncharacterized protein YjbK